MRSTTTRAAWGLLAALTVSAGVAPAGAARAGVPEGADALRAAVQDGRRMRVIARMADPATAAGTVAAAEAADRALRRHLGASAAASLRRLGDLPLVALEVDAERLEALVASGVVESVEEDVPLRPTVDRNIAITGVPTVWSQGVGGQGEVIAILDSGVDAAHPFLKGRVVAEACFSSNVAAQGATSLCRNGKEKDVGKGAARPCPARLDECYHGTHVAGIAAGKGNAHSGVAPFAKLVSVQVYSRVRNRELCKFVDECILAYTSDIIQGLSYVRGLLGTYRIAAANLSLGDGSYRHACDKRSIKAAIDALRAKGVATVVAAGNDGDTRAVSFPACVSTAVAVASSGDHKPEQITGFSNFSPLVAVVAPGEAIVSSVPGGGFQAFSGTSMAAPHVAGAWALLKSVYPRLAVSEVDQALRRTGQPIEDPYADGLTRPRIDVAKALVRLRASEGSSGPR